MKTKAKDIVNSYTMIITPEPEVGFLGNTAQHEYVMADGKTRARCLRQLQKATLAAVKQGLKDGTLYVPLKEMDWAGEPGSFHRWPSAAVAAYDYTCLCGHSGNAACDVTTLQCPECKRMLALGLVLMHHTHGPGTWCWASDRKGVTMRAFHCHCGCHDETYTKNPFESCSGCERRMVFIADS